MFDDRNDINSASFEKDDAKAQHEESWENLDDLPSLTQGRHRRRNRLRPRVIPPAFMIAIIMVVILGVAGLLTAGFILSRPDYSGALAELDDYEGYVMVEPDEALVDGASGNDLFNYRWPCAGEVSSLYGKRVHPISKQEKFHSGLDIAAPYWEQVFAIGDGEIEWAARKGGKGNLVVIRHNNKYESHYFHLQKIHVKKGAKVLKGDLIGWVGSTGYSKGPHLHLEIHKYGVPVNPAKYLPPPDEDRLVRLREKGIAWPIGGNN
jgi:hypothetical protein